jgi:hypothetical protein
MKMAKEHSIRRLYSPEMAKVRYELYRGATGRIKSAIESGYWIEAIALSESVIADRLEARISLLNDYTDASRRLGTIGSLVRRLISTEKHEGYEALHSLYLQIIQWSHLRNKAIHNAVKVSEDDNIESWESRYAALEHTARTGYELFKMLKAEYDKIKRRDIKKRELSC